jgi:preprotein translocase subunit SecB
LSDEQPQRQFTLQRIYTKDLSFEAPNSPAIFQKEWTPEIKVGLGSNVNRVGDGVVEVVLNVNVEAKHEGKTVFMVEVHQGGIFAVQGFDDKEQEALMAIAAPNVLFPYVREVVSDLVTRGSFPQFVLQPVNFEAVYAQQQQKRAAQQPDGAAEQAQ